VGVGDEHFQFFVKSSNVVLHGYSCPDMFRPLAWQHTTSCNHSACSCISYS